jgi:diguanylate cyclase (GGDEF)-like protein/PAS domain S-box-containing protein
MTRDNRHLHHPRGAGRALRLLISCNRALFHATEEHQLLSEVCRLVVDSGGYLMAWVGFAREDADKSIEPVASAGDETGYLRQIHLTWADNERGRAPTGAAIRTGTPQINRNFLTNPALAPWRDLAIQRGYQSSIALPLAGNGAVLGALSIYAREPDAFDTEEIGLLEELARDLAFGMTALRGRAEAARLRAEIKTTEAALHGSREQYRQFVELSNEGIWSLDAELNTNFVNPAVCRMLGYEAGEMLGRPVNDFVMVDEQDKLAKEMHERKEGIDRRGTVERRFRRKDGGACWGLVTATWLKDAHGVVQGGFAMVTDITERKRMERALAENRETFQMLVDSSPTAINILHGDRLLFVNPAMERLSGYSRDELLGMKMTDLIHPDSRQTVANRAAARQRGEHAPSHYEFQLVTKDGKTRWIDVSATRVVYEGKVCSLGSLLDVTERKEAERTLRASEERFQTLFDRASEGILIVSLEGKLLAANEAFARMHGYTRQELLALSLQDLDTPEARALIPERMRRIREEGALTFEVENYHKDGHVFPMEVAASLVTVHGEAVVQSFCRDITERKKAEEELRLAAQVFEHAGEGVLVTDDRNLIIAANPAFTQITGYRLDEVRGKNPRIFASGRHDKEFYRAMWESIIGRGFWQGEIWDRNKNGEIHAKHLTISVIRGADGRAHRYVALFTDITQKKQSEELIWRQANFDALTGLPNRQMFQDRLAQESKKSHRTAKPMALLLIDLDRFKEVNDTLGHHKGDMLLVDAAQRISGCVRDSDTVARLGGDEFVVILSELDDADSIDRIAQELVDSLADPFKLGADEVYISASVGISLYPTDSPRLEDLLKNADQAMYSAKNAGRNRFGYFTPDMQAAALTRLRLTGDLRAALAQGQFRIHYQPIVELATGRIRKAEALLRWQHPNKGVISPMEFVPLAEDTGLIVPIGEWVFRQAAEQAGKWRAAHDAAFEISVNKSPVQVRHNAGNGASWPEHLRQLGLPGSAVTVEITERLLMNAEATVNEKLQSFHDAGMHIAIDDFGTGYSSLAYLRDFDVDYLKIDRSFIHDLETNKDHRALCEGIIVMAHKLGMRVVAEGVETSAQRDLLRASGCDFAQGYLFGKAVPADEFEALLAPR